MLERDLGVRNVAAGGLDFTVTTVLSKANLADVTDPLNPTPIGATTPSTEHHRQRRPRNPRQDRHHPHQRQHTPDLQQREWNQDHREGNRRRQPGRLMSRARQPRHRDPGIETHTVAGRSRPADLARFRVDDTKDGGACGRVQFSTRATAVTAADWCVRVRSRSPGNPAIGGVRPAGSSGRAVPGHDKQHYPPSGMPGRAHSDGLDWGRATGQVRGRGRAW